MHLHPVKEVPRDATGLSLPLSRVPCLSLSLYLHVSLSFSPFLSLSLSFSPCLSPSLPTPSLQFSLYVRYTHALFIICLCCNFFTTIQDNQDVHDFTGEQTSCRELFVGHTGCNSCIMLFIFVHVSLMFVAFYETVLVKKLQ